MLAVAGDITVEDDREQFVSAVLDRFGRIDVLVNNAGTGMSYPAEDEPLDHWEQVLDVNLTGLFRVTQLAVRPMLAQGAGSVVNISSIAGLVASAPIKQASYTAAKGAIVNLTRELACQWARRGVRVNAIAPGWFPTEMTAPLFEDERATEFVRRNCPMGRAGGSHELDGVLLFLASNASTYVTGTTIPVDGGWTAR